MPHRMRILAVAIPGVALAATLAAWQGLSPAPPSPAIALAAWAICACYALIACLAAQEEIVWLLRHALKAFARRPRQPEPEPEPGQKKADAAPQKQGALPWDSLPVVAIPPLARTARESVIAFARQHGLRPFEAERGFVLADNAGNYYRAAFNL